jgi:hypothetical protein
MNGTVMAVKAGLISAPALVPASSTSDRWAKRSASFSFWASSASTLAAVERAGTSACEAGACSCEAGAWAGVEPERARRQLMKPTPTSTSGVITMLTLLFTYQAVHCTPTETSRLEFDMSNVFCALADMVAADTTASVAAPFRHGWTPFSREPVPRS